MRKAGAALIAAVMAFGAAEVSAQSDTQIANASINIPTIIAIDVVGTDIAFGSVAETDYGVDGTGYATTAPQSVITTRSNVVHRLTIHANTADMTGPNTKPASHLEWDLDGAGSFTGLTTSAVDVLTNISRGAAERATISYRMFLDLATDEPGDYALGFTFTAIAP
jgi:hypothetical protein